jgi:DeoR/GlpR family transcriptional regulator of sugar metabolism
LPTTVQRRAAILTLLDRNGAVRNSDLASSMGVAAKTIRNDLQVLSRHRHITPVHGGAVVTLDAVSGLRSSSPLQAEIDRAMIETAGDVVVVANHTAWNAVALVRLAPLNAATALISSTALDFDAQLEVRAAVRELHLVCPQRDQSQITGNAKVEAQCRPPPRGTRPTARSADRHR